MAAMSRSIYQTGIEGIDMWTVKISEKITGTRYESIEADNLDAAVTEAKRMVRRLRADGDNWQRWPGPGPVRVSIWEIDDDTQRRPDYAENTTFILETQQ
jgi:hypothetical protein